MTNATFREQGNERFKAGEYKEAEDLYSKAYVLGLILAHVASNTDFHAASLNTLAPTRKSLPIEHSRD